MTESLKRGIVLSGVNAASHLHLMLDAERAALSCRAYGAEEDLCELCDPTDVTPAIEDVVDIGTLCSVAYAHIVEHASDDAARPRLGLTVENAERDNPMTLILWTDRIELRDIAGDSLTIFRGEPYSGDGAAFCSEAIRLAQDMERQLRALVESAQS